MIGYLQTQRSGLEKNPKVVALNIDQHMAWIIRSLNAA